MNFEFDSRFRSIFHGHFDFYGQDLSDVPNRTVSLFAFRDLSQLLKKDVPEAEKDALRFMAVYAPPYITTNRQESGFNVYGPLYSLVVETARYLNSSLTGINTESENVVWAWGAHKPHFILTLLWPRLSIFQILRSPLRFDLMAILGIPKVIQLTRALGNIELDAIMGVKQYFKKPLFSFLFVVDKFCFSVLFGLLFLVSLVLCLKNNPVAPSRPGRQPRTQWRPLLTNWYNWFRVLVRIMLNPHIAKLKADLVWLVLLWMEGMFILAIYYTGEMLSEMTRDHPLNIIDDWNDLYDRKDVTIYIFNTNIVNGRETRDYFTKGTVFAEDFEKRLVQLPMSFYASRKLMEQFKRGLNEKEVLMAIKSDLLYSKNTFPNGRTRFHVSKQAADSQPHFLATTHFASEAMEDALDLIILRLTEGGIYQKWLTAFTESPPDEVRDWRPASFQDFLGCFVLYFINFMLILLTAFVEILFEWCTNE